MRTRVLLVVFCLGVACGWAEWIEPPTRTRAGYPVPHPDPEVLIPAAHGAHPEYAIEWWYWVGHLRDDRGGEHGFQAVVFRLARDPGSPESEGATTTFGADQLYLAHVGWSDITAGQHRHAERIHRSGWQARTAVGKLDLNVGTVTAREGAGGEGFDLEFGVPGGREVSLRLVPEKPLVVFGDRGLSRKGADPAAVSWYWTYTRLRAEGVLRTGQEEMKIEGIAWMDHEISSSQLGGDLEGWDWTAIQLDDGTEVKAYRLRRPDGGMDPWSAVYWIDHDGKSRSVYAEGFRWETERVWTSPETGNVYPIAVRIVATDPDSGAERVYRLRPLMDGQEFVGNDGKNAYWEGACEVLDREGNAIGRAYLELAGYGGGLASRLNRE